MKFFLYSIFIILIAATLSICAIKPDMHKAVFVFDSAYTIVPEKQIETEKEVVPIMEKVSEPVKVVKTISEPQKTEVKKVVKQEKNTEVKTKPLKEIKTVKNETTAKITKPVVKQETKTVQKTETKEVQTPPKTEQVKITEPIKTTAKVLTEKEEDIAWNTWRSNLQNKIMQDVKLPIIPNGVVFKFSFSVDKFGRISNVQTWSTTSTYTPYAIQYIAPVIRSYQGKSILNFPSGTARTTTQVTGGWKISENERYSTPQDYHDVEKIKK